VCEDARTVSLAVDAARAMRERAQAVDDLGEHARVRPAVLAGDGHQTACVPLFHTLLRRHAEAPPPHKQKPPDLGGFTASCSTDAASLHLRWKKKVPRNRRLSLREVLAGAAGETRV